MRPQSFNTAIHSCDAKEYLFAFQCNYSTGYNDAKRQGQRYGPEVLEGGGRVAKANYIHTEEAGHKVQREEEDCDHGEHEDRFAVVVLERFDQLYVLDRV